MIIEVSGILWWFMFFGIILVVLVTINLFATMVVNFLSGIDN